jgi:hypothetical protein
VQVRSIGVEKNSCILFIATISTGTSTTGGNAVVFWVWKHDKQYNSSCIHTPKDTRGRSALSRCHTSIFVRYGPVLSCGPPVYFNTEILLGLYFGDTVHVYHQTKNDSSSLS